MVYFIGDLHLGHDNIIKLSKRPFANIVEMNQCIIENWNSIVTPNDIVYILGDVSFKSEVNPVEVLWHLKGQKVLITGNHDITNLRNPEFRRCFKDIKDILTINLGGQHIVMCHYPLLEWDGYFRGAWHIHGHIHNNISNPAYRFLVNEPHALNAAVDITGFVPVTFEKLCSLNQEFKYNNRV